MYQVCSPKMRQVFSPKLYQWAQYRHRRKSPGWRFERYWQRQGTRDAFSDETGTLARHEDTPIVRHVKSLP